MAEGVQPSQDPRFWTRGTVAFFIAIGVILLLFVIWLVLNATSVAAVRRQIEAIREARAVADRVGGIPGWRALFVQMMMPALDRALVRLARATAQLDVARVGLACELFISAHGRPPDRLDDLVPGVLPRLPDDVFTGTALQFARRGDGFVVYSLGENLKDDGGMFKQGDWEGSDVVWEH